MKLLDKYFERLGLPLATEHGPLELLRKIHHAHLHRIPFENLSIHLGEKVSLKLSDIERKLIDEKRGGYCFEHNLLSLAILTALGFNVKLRGARVIKGDVVMPMTHLVLEVAADGVQWLYDVGFGGSGILFPQNFSGDVQQQQFFEARLREESTQWLLEKRFKDSSEWIPTYAIQKMDFYSFDCEVASHYTSTHPESIFTKTVTVQLHFPEYRVMYRKSDVLWKTLLTKEGETTSEAAPSSALEDLKRNFGYQETFFPSLEKVLY